MNNIDPYNYKAVVKSIGDGDTCVLRIDLGFGCELVVPCRLSGIDTPERGDLNYKEAGLFLASLIPPGTSVLCTTVKPKEKWGRYLAWIARVPDGLDVNKAMVMSDFARVYAGGTRRPWPKAPLSSTGDATL